MIARLGDKEIVRAYQGENVIYPTPIRDGLVLWYDFKGKQNTDVIKNVAEDLSGNGNHGDLQNFAYTEGSGYGEGLKFDGVDDVIRKYNLIVEDDFPLMLENPITLEMTVTIKTKEKPTLYLGYGFMGYLYYVEDSYFYVRGTRFSVVDLFDPTLPVHFVLTIDPEESSKVYVNTELQAQQSLVKPLETSYIAYGYGYSGNLGAINLFSSRIYNKALSPEEIQHNYKLEKERWNL